MHNSFIAEKIKDLDWLIESRMRRSALWDSWFSVWSLESQLKAGGTKPTVVQERICVRAFGAKEVWSSLSQGKPPLKIKLQSVRQCNDAPTKILMMSHAVVGDQFPTQDYVGISQITYFSDALQPIFFQEICSWFSFFFWSEKIVSYQWDMTETALLAVVNLKIDWLSFIVCESHVFFLFKSSLVWYFTLL